jgi:PBP1b-binding outer membrane lipoprotein LpoB
MTRMAILGTVLLSLLLQAGCSSMKLPEPAPKEDAAKRYGPYCEQLGNMKGTADYDACLKRMEDTYQ